MALASGDDRSAASFATARENIKQTIGRAEGYVNSTSFFACAKPFVSILQK